MKYYTMQDRKAKEFYSNIQDAIQNAMIYGGSVYDEHERLIIKVDKNDR